jgi:hypothetical protein
MSPVTRLYYFINILSIDIVAGAIVSALFFAKLFQVHVRPYGLLALGLTVWIIYTIDHLRDAKRIKHRASTKRHRFHQQHFQSLIVFVGIAILLDIIAIFFIRLQIFERGMALAFIVTVYLIGQRSLRFLKEIFIALLYTCGVLLLSISVTHVQLNSMHYLLIVQFGLIAWINLVMFSWFDKEYDQQDNQNSFVTILGQYTTKICLYSLFGLNFLLTVIQIYLHGLLSPFLVLLLMNATLLFIFLFRTVLSKNDLYRLIGDAVFFFPVFFLI